MSTSSVNTDVSLVKVTDNLGLEKDTIGLENDNMGLGNSNRCLEKDNPFINIHVQPSD